MAAASILEVVEDFILGDTSFEDDFQDFALEHCDIFDNKEVRGLAERGCLGDCPCPSNLVFSSCSH